MDVNGEVVGSATKETQNTKKVKSQGDDLISYLPESILTHILSKLPTKDAVKTSVLSRNWEYKWTCIESMHFDDNWILTRQRTKRSKFFKFVERVLLLCESSKIKDFFISYHCGGDTRYLKQWMYVVMKRNVETLTIHYAELKPHKFIIPGWFFDYNSLRELKVVVNGTIKIPVICFPNLRLLTFGGIRFVGEQSFHSNQLLLNLPALEVLNLSCCEWSNIATTKIDAPVLVDFRICYPRTNLDDECVVEICATRLVALTYVNSPYEQFVLHHSLAVLNATLEYTAQGYSELRSVCQSGLKDRGLLNKLLGVRHLNLSCDIIPVLVLTTSGVFNPFFDKIIQLKVDRCNSNIMLSVPVLISFLLSMPNLENLVLEKLSLAWHDFTINPGLPSLDDFTRCRRTSAVFSVFP